MKVLSLGLDKKVLDEDSEVAQRAIVYGKKVEKYLVVVPGQKKSLKLSNNVFIKSRGSNNKIIALFKLRKYLKYLIKQEKFDLITIQDVYFLASLGLCLANKFGLKSEIQVHGFEKLGGIRRYLAKKNLRRADLIRVVSERLKKQLITDFKVAENKIYIAPVAVDVDKIKNSDTSNELKQKYKNKFIFLTVGRLVAVKNIKLQIKALARINNKNVQLVIAGEGSEKLKLQNLVEELNLQDQVNFIGWQDDLGGIYKIADCFLLTSDSEGYGMVVAEAVLADLPVIMTDVGVAGELVKNNKNGFVIPVNSLDVLVEKMQILVDDKNLLSEFGKNSSQFKNEILTQDQLINKIILNWGLISYE
jgi:glycosyltransferase involved in cell wall biosynthesis